MFFLHGHQLQAGCMFLFPESASEGFLLYAPYPGGVDRAPQGVPANGKTYKILFFQHLRADRCLLLRQGGRDKTDVDKQSASAGARSTPPREGAYNKNPSLALSGIFLQDWGLCI